MSAEIFDLQAEIERISNPLKGRMAHTVFGRSFRLQDHLPVVCRTLTKPTSAGAMSKNKNYCVGWGGDSSHCCVATQSGHVLVFDATQTSGVKGGVQVKLPITAPKVMKCAMSRDTANMKVACGGYAHSACKSHSRSHGPAWGLHGGCMCRRSVCNPHIISPRLSLSL